MLVLRPQETPGRQDWIACVLGLGIIQLYAKTVHNEQQYRSYSSEQTEVICDSHQYSVRRKKTRLQNIQYLQTCVMFLYENFRDY